MNNFIAITSFLLASLASVDAQHRLIGNPTGMLHPGKQRKIEQALNFQRGGLPKGAASSKNEKSASSPKEKGQSKEGGRDLQQWNYHAPTPPMYWPYKPYEPDAYGGYKTGKKYWMMGKGGKKTSTPDYDPDDCRYSHTIVKNPFNDVDELYCDDDDCEMFVSAEHIRLQEFTTVMIAGGGNSTQSLGTTYIWGTQFPEDSEGNPDTSATIQGSCLRTGVDAASAGQCSYTIITDVGQITMSGSIMTNGGNLAITGGSGEFAGVIGDAQFSVVAIGDGDPFDDAAYYDIELTLGLIVCPAQYLGE
mmetsp:Transcript_17264/g.40678  ORF Transcript_17264/g.40678 Transcript_17264/m.40678 type:complete len:305 (-) Transcript_17264:92-1006(-)|eukprot:CAMPEP_0168749758 /NCGR_PEP_ID=MMETSP0724-20121128/16889_1 /TAXON_ID=265536 /ORGANISM="Amphiprora sp., Strain CCMP467" /LENGTH=304 /DNA_ID=CAMNT_0008797693 /DNA_START=60 /DNA_END=974 /DNA_ORIENTATION=+